jgi:hypothetical protein
VRQRNGRLVTELSVEPFRMQGLAVVVRHREGRPLTQARAHAHTRTRGHVVTDARGGAWQVREVRLTVSTLNQHGDLRQETVVGVYTLPLVPSNTVCYVDAPLDVRGSLVTVECVSSYGDLVRTATHASMRACVCVYVRLCLWTDDCVHVGGGWQDLAPLAKVQLY